MKSILLSKTFWFAILKIAFGAVGFLAGWLEPLAAWAFVVAGLADIGLRIKTTTSVGI